MRPSAHAEAAALRWLESVENPSSDDERPHPPRLRIAPRPSGPRPSGTAEGAAIRLLDRESDDEPAPRRAA